MNNQSSENKRYRIALIPGDGIGHEVVPAAKEVLESLALPIEFTQLDAGWQTFQETGTALPDSTLETVRTCDGALFGAVSSPSQRVSGYTSPIIALRKALDLYANLRPIVSAPVPNSQPNIDLLIVRENTEGLYVKQEHVDASDPATGKAQRTIAQRVITRKASERIARTAFMQATERFQQRQQNAQGTSTSLVTIVHKANVLSLSDGLFRESALAVADEYPDVQREEQLVDSMLYRLILEPQRYDVIVAPNLYGDILSDGAAALVGGLGLIPSANVGDNFVLAEPVHGSAPDIQGKGIANPVATIRATALLLRSLDPQNPTLQIAAQKIETAVFDVLSSGVWTADLGGNAQTADVTASIIACF